MRVGSGLLFVYPPKEDGLYVGGFGIKMLELHDELDRENEKKTVSAEIDATAEARLAKDGTRDQKNAKLGRWRYE